YSWGYLCQMPRVADPSIVNMAVVVYNRRSLGMGAGGMPLSEYYYASSFNTSNNVITLTSSSPPPVRLGEWVLDCTQVASPPSAHGYFYRVVNITDNGNGTFDLEVQTPLRGFAPGGGTFAGQCMILEGVVEVFERNTSWVP